jgi:hypothetical protein
MPRNLSLEVSPASQRRLQRGCEAGIGFSARHLPFANWKKSVQGAVLVSMSPISTLLRGFDSARAGVADSNVASIAKSVVAARRIGGLHLLHPGRAVCDSA